jgi:hypothetical protein
MRRWELAQAITLTSGANHLVENEKDSTGNTELPRFRELKDLLLMNRARVSIFSHIGGRGLDLRDIVPFGVCHGFTTVSEICQCFLFDSRNMKYATRVIMREKRADFVLIWDVGGGLLMRDLST